MKKKAFLLIIFVLLACMLAGTLAACDRGDDLPTTTPVSWEKYLEDAADRIADSIVLDGGKIGVKFSSDVTAEGEDYTFLLGLNYDLTAADAANSCLVLEVRQATSAAADEGELSDISDASSDDGVLFRIVCDSSSTWIDIASGLALSDAHLQVESVGIFDLLGVAFDEDNIFSAQEAFSDIIFNLGRAFFDGVRVDADGDTYVFNIDDSYKETGREYFNTVLTVFGENVANSLLAAFGISDSDELFDMLPDMSGEVVLTFPEDGGALLSADNLTVSGGDAGMNAEFEVQRELYPEFAEKIPGDDAVGYVRTKVGNSHMEGTLSLVRDGGTLVSYDYVLDANLDLLTLMFNDYDLTSLDEDNYFHLRVTHTCTAACDDFCASRLSPSRGALIDLAFSPQDFDGSYNVYISVGLSSLISSDRAAEINELMGVTSGTYIPEYVLLTYPYDDFDESSLPCRMLLALYAGNMFTTGRVEMDMNSVSGIVDPIVAVLNGEGVSVDKLVFDIESNEFAMAQPHDIYSETVYIIDSSVGDVKGYGLFGDQNVLSWEWEEPVAFDIDGESVSITNIYDEEGMLLHGVQDGEYIPMSPEEITGMVGRYFVKAQCTAIDKTSQFDFYGRVLEIENLDIDERGVQEVVFTVEYPGPLSALASSGVIPEDAYESSDELTTEVTVRVLLTGRSSADVEFMPHVASDAELSVLSADTPGVGGIYTGQSTVMPEYVYADARVRYDNGYVKEMTLVGECDELGVHYAIFSHYYYTKQCGEITVRWSFMDRTYERTYYIQPPDRIEFDIDEENMPAHSVGDTVYMSTLTNNIDAIAYYDNDDGTSKGIKLYLTAENLFINGIALSESSSYWISGPMMLGNYTVEFLVASTYSCHVEAFGFESESFAQRVDAYLGDDASYTFTQSFTEPDFWFTGTEYEFSGNITNATHGINDTPERTLSVVVERYSADNPRYPETVDFTAEGAAVSVTSFETSARFAATDDAGVLTSSDFPAIIVGPIEVSFGLVFNAPGYYRIRLRLSGDGGFTVYWYVTVAE